MLEVVRVKGKLVLVKIISPLSLEEIAAADRQMAQAEAETGGKVVICADCRATALLPQADADALLEVFKSHNDRVERSAILASEESAMAALQMARVIRQANLPARRSFKSWEELAAWLGEVLTAEERERLTAIFG